MEFSESAFKEMTDLVRGALKFYFQPTETPVVTDIHLQPLRESGELIVSDDDRELKRSVISELAELPDDSFSQVMEKELRAVLKEIDKTTPLETLNIWKPFNFVMVDDEGETVAELMLFDDENQLLSQTLMDGLDKDLENFLKELMAD